jgi:anti-sigma factor RsiW
MSDIHDKHPSEDLLQAFLDGDVPSRERRRIEAHVASCTRCTEEVAGWRSLFEDLDGLASHRPTSDFAERVMAGVRVPDELPWAARMKARVSALLRPTQGEHLSAGVLQDLSDGILAARESTRAMEHVRGCTVCAAELHAWSAVMDRLSGLETFAPTASFADGVMAALTAEAGAEEAVAVAPAPSGSRTWTKLVVTAKRFVPHTRRAWAAIAGVSVTPAVTFGLVLWAVFSHPALTPQALASFAVWQLRDLSVMAWEGLVNGGLEAARITGLDGFIEAMAQAPLLTASVFALYAIVMVASARILYKNLFAGRSGSHRYASASAS